MPVLPPHARQRLRPAQRAGDGAGAGWGKLVPVRALLVSDIAYHRLAQDGVDPRLVATASGLEPSEHVGVEAQRELLL